jgi:peptidyl-prolyl cis-trans isomerase A (cyclophilin A)
MRRYLILTAVLLLTILGCSDSKTSASAPEAASQPAAQPDPQKKAGDLPDISNVTGVVFDTTAGELRCSLFAKETPITVANFVGLSEGTKEWKHPATGITKRKTPLYPGTIFHRVIPNFMIQGGDAAGNGTGSPGYTFRDEIVPGITFDRPGRLAMANSGPGTNGSQFFITEVPTPHLNGRHTIFGQCTPASVALLKKIARMPRDPRTDRAFNPVKINKVTILRGEQPGAKPAAKPATRKKPASPATKPE